MRHARKFEGGTVLMFFKTRWLAGGAMAAAALVSLGVTGLAPTRVAAQELRCADIPLVGTWRLNKAKSKITRNNGVIAGRLVIIAPYGSNGITYVFIDDDDKRISGR